MSQEASIQDFKRSKKTENTQDQAKQAELFDKLVDEQILAKIVTKQQEEESAPEPENIKSDQEISADLEKDNLAQALQEINKDNFYQPGYSDLFNKLSLEKRLELLSLSKSNLAEISDSLVLNGYWEKKHLIRGKLPLILRTRETDVNMRVLAVLK